MAAALLAACGGDDDSDAGRGLGDDAGPGVAGPRYPYPAETVSTFVRECAKSGSRSVCECTIDRLQRTLPYEEFTDADRAIREEKPLPRQTRATIDEATDACRE